MRVEPMDAPLGAFVRDVDFDAIDADALRAALDQHRLLCVRGQEITDDEHVAFASVFGHLAVERTGAIGIVSNTRPDGTLGADEATWHSDYTFFPSPYECISLYAIELPAHGTRTAFVDGALAARTLPAELRRRLDGVQSRAVAKIEPSMSLTGGVRYLAGRCDG